jgi:hypothetical protein
MGTTFGNPGESPYLADSGRLADVIAAIQALGTYKFYKLSFEGWADRITANKNQALYLKKRFRTAPGILPSRRRTGKSVACLAPSISEALSC